MDKIQKNNTDVKKKFNFDNTIMPFGVMIVFALSSAIGWFTEGLSLYYTQVYFITEFPGYKLAASAFGFASDFSKCLGIIYLFLYPVQHSWQNYRLEWESKNTIIQWIENILNGVFSFFKSVFTFLKKESERILVHLIIAQGIILSTVATHSALTVNSWDANRESSEYQNVANTASQKEQIIAELRQQNELKQDEINSNNQRIERSANELEQTRYKGLVYQNERDYRARNQELSREIERNNDRIYQITGEISALKAEETQIEKSDVGRGNIFFKKLQSIGGGRFDFDFAIYIFSFGLEIIAAYFLSRWVRENREQILEWFGHVKRQKKIKNSIKFAHRQADSRERFLIAMKQISERSTYGVTPDVIASVFRDSNIEFFRDKIDNGGVLTEAEILQIEEAINRGKALPPPVEKSLPAEQMNRMLVNGRPMTDDEKKELAGAMENMPGVYDDDTPEFQRIKGLAEQWKQEEKTGKKIGFSPDETEPPNSSLNTQPNTAEQKKSECSVSVRRTTPNKKTDFTEHFSEQLPNSENAPAKSREEAEKIIMEVFEKNPKASVREIGKIAGMLAFERGIKKNSNPYSPGTVQPVLKKKAR